MNITSTAMAEHVTVKSIDLAPLFRPPILSELGLDECVRLVAERSYSI